MKKRILKDGTSVEELPKAVPLTILTKCPKKWKIVDLETGQCYIGSGKLEIYKQWKLIENKDA